MQVQTTQRKVVANKMTMRRWTRRFGGYFFATVTVVATLVGTIYGVTSFIDGRIASALSDPATLHKIAIMARPEMIIDAKGTVLIDRGAMDYIQDFQVTTHKEVPILVHKVRITPKRYMALPPLITTVDCGFVSVTSERVEKLDWLLTIEYGGWDGDKPNRVRIEIIDR